MKIGIVANILRDKSLNEALAFFKEKGLHTIELGCGGYAGKTLADPEELLSDSSKLEEFKSIFFNADINICALSCHGNPIHPDKEAAHIYDTDMRNAVLLAEELGIDTITCFSGCAGDCPESKYPNWVTCSWPDDYTKILEYQWSDVLIPYWQDFTEFCRKHGVNKIAIELHPGFMAYNTESFKKLRNAIGPEIGITFDPSHLIWQGMDPIAVIRDLKDSIYHVHAKDVKIDRINTSLNGVLDTKHYEDELDRSWIFRTIGYGHDSTYWKAIFSALRAIGYDGPICIEHEDSLINRYEGLDKALSLIEDSVLIKERSPILWA